MNSIKYSKKEKTRIACRVPGCITTFSRKADCYRHVAEVHGEAKKCPVKGCTYQNTKRDGRLTAHMESAHPDLYKPVSLDIPSSAWEFNWQGLGKTSNVVSEEFSYVYPPPMDFNTLQSGPSETQFETPGDIKNWYREYQSDEHASENNHWEYDSTSGSMNTTSIADVSKNHANLDPTTLDYMNRGLNTEETTQNEAVIQKDLEGVDVAGKKLGHESQTHHHVEMPRPQQNIPPSQPNAQNDMQQDPLLLGQQRNRAAIEKKYAQLGTCPECYETFPTFAGYTYHVSKKKCSKEGKPTNGWKFWCNNCKTGFITKQGNEYHILNNFCNRSDNITPATSSSRQLQQEAQQSYPAIRVHVPTTGEGDYIDYEQWKKEYAIWENTSRLDSLGHFTVEGERTSGQKLQPGDEPPNSSREDIGEQAPESSTSGEQKGVLEAPRYSPRNNFKQKIDASVEASPQSGIPSPEVGLGPNIWTETRFLPRFVRQAEVPGEGTCYFYEDGTHCQAVINGEGVNPHWGVTEIGLPRKRLSAPCHFCKVKGFICFPDYPRCVRCKHYGLACQPGRQSGQDLSAEPFIPTSSTTSAGELDPPGRHPHKPPNREDQEIVVNSDEANVDANLFAPGEHIAIPASWFDNSNQQRQSRPYTVTMDNADIDRLTREAALGNVIVDRSRDRMEASQTLYPDPEILSDKEDDACSDISSPSSVASIPDSIFSLISRSSMSSATGAHEAGERLVQLLLGDEAIRSTCELGVRFILADRFERNMRRLLKTFAAELKKEAQSPAQRQAANFVMYRARNSAHRIRNTFYKDKEEDDPRSGTTAAVTPLSATHPRGVGEFEQQEDSEESDGVELEDEPGDLQDLERFLKSSAAMVALYESLRAFVCPLKESHAVPEPTSEKDTGLLREQDDDFSKAEIVNSAVDTAPSENGSNNTSILASEDDPEVTMDFTTIFPENMDELELLNKENHPPNKESNLLMQKSTPTENDKMPIEKVGRTLREAVKSAMQKLGIRLEMVLFGTTHLLRRSMPLEGKTRIKWKCRCGHEICDDFIELVPGAAERYRQNMEQKYLLHKERKVALSTSEILTSALVVYGLFLSVYIFVFSSMVMIFENFEAFSLTSQMATANLYTAVFLLPGIWVASWLFISGWPYSGREAANPGNRQCKIDSRTKKMMSPIQRAFYQGRRLFRIFRSLLGGGITDIDLELPTFNVSNETSDEREPQTVPPSDLLFLLLCYSEGRYATKLLQLDLVELRATSDKMLFKLLRANYKSMRGNWFSWASFKTLSWIKFVHFEMYKSELIDVRKEDELPPKDHVDYKYSPAPGEHIPPVGYQHMMHLFHNPECAEDELLCLSRFPKKLKEKLMCNGGVKPGWGLQFVETWNWMKIWLITFSLFGLGSLFFGVLWARYKTGIQDGFSIAQYMIGFAAFTVCGLQAALLG